MLNIFPANLAVTSSAPSIVPISHNIVLIRIRKRGGSDPNTSAHIATGHGGVGHPCHVGEYAVGDASGSVARTGQKAVGVESREREGSGPVVVVDGRGVGEIGRRGARGDGAGAAGACEGECAVRIDVEVLASGDRDVLGWLARSAILLLFRGGMPQARTKNDLPLATMNPV